MGDNDWNGTIGSGSGCAEMALIALLAIAVPAFYGMGYGLMYVVDHLF